MGTERITLTIAIDICIIRPFCGGHSNADLESDVEDAAEDLAHEILGEYCSGVTWIFWYICEIAILPKPF